MKNPLIAGAISAFILVTTAIVAQAQGGLSIADIGGGGTSPANSSILTATNLTIGNAFSHSGTGVFASLASQDFGAVTFSPSLPGSFVLSDTAFGTFTSTAITLNSESSQTIAFDITGDYTSGTFDGGAFVNQPAALTVAFNQPVVGGAISDSATFALTPVPEPGTLALIGLGAGLACTWGRRKN